jgi:hypothetical protein
MEWLKSTFFEDPAYVYIGLGLAMLVLGAIWRKRRGHAWLAAALAMPLLAVGVFIIERAGRDRSRGDRQSVPGDRTGFVSRQV